VGGEALLDGLADLADVDCVGGNAFFFDEPLYLQYYQYVMEHVDI
jgi:hypothetical protein